METHVDWMIHAAGGGLLALLWWLFTRDRLAIDKKLQELDHENSQYGEELARTDERQKEIKKDIDDLKTGQHHLGSKIDTVLMEVRRRR